MYKGILDILERVYYGRIKAGEIDPGLHFEQFKELFKGIEKGMDLQWKDVDYSTPDGRMLEFMRENVFVFSAFKNHQELLDISSKLIGEDGKLREWSDFKAEALKIHEEYNVSWLNAEYNHAVASGQMAGKWARIVDDSRILPYLRFNAVRDNRTTPLCSSLDATVKRYDDVFWDLYYPPNHWGCRSDVDQLDRGTETPNEKIRYPDIPDMFKYNVGKQGIAFPPKHPYFKVQNQYRQNLAKQIQDLKDENGIFTPSKSTKDAEVFALQNGLAESAKYKGLDINIVNDVNRALFTLKQKTGLAYNNILTYTDKKNFLSPMLNLTAREPGTSNFTFSLKINLAYFNYFKDYEGAIKSVSSSYDKKWWAPKDIMGLAFHEFGHRLTLRKGFAIDRRLPGLSGISKYAQTNPLETMAETFCTFMQDGKSNIDEIHLNLFNRYSEWKIE